MATGGQRGRQGGKRGPNPPTPSGRSRHGAASPTRSAALRARIEQLRRRPGGQPTAPVRKKRVPRYERDRRRQRFVRVGAAVAAGLIALILVAGTLNEFVIKPRQAVASVNGVAIPRADYWKVRAVDLLEQARQYEEFADLVGPEQGGQYLQIAEGARAQVPKVWGSTEVDPTTLNRMIDDRLYLDGLSDFGLAVSPDEAEFWMLNQFAPPDAPLQSPTPTPTMIPARAATATATARAAAITAMAEPGLAPTAAPLPAPPGRQTPAATPEPPATPDVAAARATAEAGLAGFEAGAFAEARLSSEDYRRLVAEPAVAREKVRATIAAGVGQSAEQIRAAHILVATEELAREIAGELAAGADFAELARTRSSDEQTAANGGELGWFVREEVVPAFAEVAFALQPGQTSEPFETEFGWHIVRVEDKQADRPLTDEQITRIEQVRTDRWLEDRRAAATVTSILGPTPTPEPGPFEPPLNAPPPPPPTPLPSTPAAIPVATPAASPAGD